MMGNNGGGGSGVLGLLFHLCTVCFHLCTVIFACVQLFLFVGGLLHLFSGHGESHGGGVGVVAVGVVLLLVVGCCWWWWVLMGIHVAVLLCVNIQVTCTVHLP